MPVRIVLLFAVLACAHQQALPARTAESRDRPVDARNHLRASIEAEKDDPDAYRELIRLELSLGDTATAESVAQQLSQTTRDAQTRAERQQHDQEADETRGSVVW